MAEIADSSSDGSSDADVASDQETDAHCGAGQDNCICPDWMGVRPDGACAVPQGTECFGTTGMMGTFTRCCGGLWNTGSGAGSPPCQSADAN